MIGNVVYVGGTFNNAVVPDRCHRSRANLAAFCLADGNLLSSFAANFGGGPVNALATDGASLFVGRQLHYANGGAVEPPREAQRRHWRPGHQLQP